jgi:putative transposase
MLAVPSRNVLKTPVAESYYHVYARGASKQSIFLNDADYAYFLNLFVRYLSKKPTSGKTGRPYPHFAQRIQLLAYCLMGNHFHMLIWQEDEAAMANFMRSIMTSYSRYFNLKYERTGSLFESRYKASRIDRNQYLDHISRYIHLNPRYWQHYRYSSLSYYFNDRPTWIQPNKIEELFTERAAYIQFLKDYEGQKEILEEIKHNLADN